MTRDAFQPARRRLIGLALAALAGVPARADVGATAQAAGLLDAIDAEAAARFGFRYLAQHTGEARLPELVAYLAAAIREERATGTKGISRLTALRERIRHDYRDADCVDLDGWLLSRTEARLCALAALSRAA
ncbi:MAG: hypothetical protein KDH20_23315 [Rhodocyclaceae bacterium]|nr:hypothetical protein [Rhodocyclaceae bacterium]